LFKSGHSYIFKQLLVLIITSCFKQRINSENTPETGQRYATRLPGMELSSAWLLAFLSGLYG